MSVVDDRPRYRMIRTEQDGGDCVRLTVQDTGVGLDLQNKDKLFRAFYSTKSGGMGIGVSVGRSIIEPHHGCLWAAPNDGPGATFAFSIPCRFECIPADDSFGATHPPPVTDVQHVARIP
jgi:signal transduction histidine kinase